MPQSLKLIAFLPCLLTLVMLVRTIAFQPPPRLPPAQRDSNGRLIPAPRQQQNVPPLVWMVIALPVLGAVVLLVDALMRQYEGPKALPIALAVVGLISMGMTSAIYYAI